MATIKAKANVGMTLTILFIVTLITGIILHLKKHGIVIEPRPVIKMIHWIAGFLMTGFAIIHYCHFRKMLGNMKKRQAWFRYDTWAVILFTTVTFATGLIKLLSPVKIPHLGVWHYALGLAMSAVIILHLVRGLPTWNRMRKLR